MYSMTGLVAAAMSFDMPARQAVVPNIVPKDIFANAASLYSIVWETAGIIGPAIGGFLIAGIGVSNIYLIDFLSTLVLIVALFFMRYDGKVSGEKVTISFSSILEGLRFVRSKTIIWSTMLLDFFATLFASAMVMLPIFATDILHVGPQQLGFLYAAPAFGAMLSSYIMAHRSHKIINQGKVILGAVFAYGLATILFGISRNYFLSLIALALIGGTNSISTILRQTIRQIATPDYIRGRMTSINMIFFMGGPHLGEFEAGLLAAAVGAPASVIIGGAATLIVVLAMIPVKPLTHFTTNNP